MKHSGSTLIELILVMLIFSAISYVGSNFIRKNLEKREIYSISKQLSEGFKQVYHISQYQGLDVSIWRNKQVIIMKSSNKIFYKIQIPSRYIKKIKIRSAIKTNEEIRIKSSGYASPGRIELSGIHHYCHLSISLRGRIRRTCGEN